jgi:bisanhydrobacterioruberin hydratase
MYLAIDRISGSLIRQKLYVKIFFVIFYFVGFLGIRTQYTHYVFIFLIPFTLLMSFIVILLFYQHMTKKFIIVLLTICIASYFIEVIGVNTGMIFGSYAYGHGLGIKILNTPLMIGINWVFLVCCSASIVDKLPVHYIFKIVFASILMLLYDIILEQIAPNIDMWHWKDNIVPLQNYVAWFVIAFFFQWLVKFAGVKIQNQIAAAIFVCQALFFISLIFFNV